MTDVHDAHVLTGPRWRTRIEQAVSDHLGRPWFLRSCTDLADRASHPCGLLSDGRQAVFAKQASGVHAADQLQVEFSGLRLIRELSGVMTPDPVVVLADQGEALILLGAVPEVPREREQWRDIGRALARMHAITRDLPGLESHGYFGPLYQDNRAMPDWPAFYAERRLWPQVLRGIDHGRLSLDMVRKVERIIARLPELCGPAVPMSLLHGDAQQNNFVSTATGAVVIDHAVHFGHPEVDLAMLGYFSEFPPDVLDGYRELRPIDPGFDERRDLWRLHGYLAVVAHGAEDYVPQWRAALERYL
jgi:fructosamine-3-kinase